MEKLDLEKLKKELMDLYMQGWLDRDWHIGEDEADKKSEVYANNIIKKIKEKLK